MPLIEKSPYFKNLALSVILFLPAACMDRQEKVSFVQDVKPVLDEYCVECHQRGRDGYEESGLDMTNYAGVMKGTRYGPMVIPGDSLGSNLIVLMEGRADPSIAMPHGGDGVPQKNIDRIKTWIDQGAENN